MARVKRRILEESTICVIYTGRATHEGADLRRLALEPDAG